MGPSLPCIFNTLLEKTSILSKPISNLPWGFGYTHQINVYSSLELMQHFLQVFISLMTLTLFIFIYKFIHYYLFLVVLSFRWDGGLFLVAASEGYSLFVVWGLHCSSLLCCSRARLWGARASANPCPGLYSTRSTIAAQGLSGPWASGIFPDQGWKPRLLHWQILFHWATREVA